MDNNDNININQNNNIRDNQSQNEIRNEIIRANQSEIDRINCNNNNYRRQNYNYNNDGYYLFYECNDPKSCIGFYFCALLGLGTFSVGIIEKNSFFILLGIFNLLVFVFYFVLNFVIVLDFINNRLLFVYSIVFVP